MFKKLVCIGALFITLVGQGVTAQPVAAAPAWQRPPDPDYLTTIQNTAAMVWDEQAQALAAEYDLNIVNVTWEDTGRYYGSSVGPNISDVTIQVQSLDPKTETYALTLMPVIRYPNFSDLTADISPDDFYLLVGNEEGESLQRVTLREYLGNFRHYLHTPDSWAGRETTLLAERDTHVLVSAQAAFLPIPQEGKAEFNPVIFNYQSYAGDPAVLTIVATREGSSATIIDNLRDGFPAGYSWGQRLFFNQNGERASFTGERLSDFTPENGEPADQMPVDEMTGGLNMVLIIQVPLKQKNPLIYEETMMLGSDDGAIMSAEPSSRSDVEAAVIGHGAVEGPFTEIDNLDIERDERYPIRVTVQFYKATSNGVVSAAAMKDIAAQIDQVYADADYVGSLVVDGPSDRPTEYNGSKKQPANWWELFWNRFTKNTDLSKKDAQEMLRRLKVRPR